MSEDNGSIPRGRLSRVTRLAGMATRVGAGLAADRVKRLWGGGSDNSAAEAAALRVLETLGTLKGAALKAGQTLSLFANQLPPEARAIVGRLYSQAPSLPYADIARVIEEELGAPPERVFASFSQTPLAAASLGQVHTAVLHTGAKVAVKIQYPGVGAALGDDLQNLASLLNAAGLVFDSAEYLEEIRREVLAELDYEKERTQLEQFRGFLVRWPDLVVPRSYPELSSKRVLTLELLEGPTLNEAARTADAMSEEERWRRGDQLVRAGWGPLLYHRAVHADSHPGNYLLMSDGRLGVLDFGSVKFLSERFWRANVDALAAMLDQRSEDWVALVQRGGFELNLPPQKAKPLIDEILETAGRPVQGVCDFASDDTLNRLAALKLRYPLELLRVKPPAESLLVGRGVAGVLQNLQTLKVKGDLRPFFRQALADIGRATSPGT